MQQHGEDEEDRHHQHEQQIAERFLLLLIQAAEFDHAGRKRCVRAELVANLRHGAAEVAAFEPRRDGDVLPQVFAPQFELARLSTMSATCESFTRLPSAVRSGNSRRLATSADARAVDAHADVDDAVAFEHARRASARASRC